MEQSPDVPTLPRCESSLDAQPSFQVTHFALRRRDQQTILVLLSGALLLLAAIYVLHGGLHQGLVSIDTMPPLAYAAQVDLNHCDWIELCLLPGVGEVLARRIVESRRTAGPFASVDELARVRGIGPLSIKRLRSMVCVGQPERVGLTRLTRIDLLPVQ